MKAYVCENCNAQLDPGEIQNGLLTCPYCGQIYSMNDEPFYKAVSKPKDNNRYDSTEGERAFKKLFGV